MAITLDGTKGGTASAGWYGQSAFTGTFTDGIVVDYTTGMGRISVGSSDGLTVYNGGVASTALLTLDSSGNLGLGVTPSAWSGGYKALQVGQTAVFGGNTGANRNYLSSNVFYDGSNYKYITASQATQLEQSNGAFYWFQAGSGSAGGTISFTQAMTLDASGNLLVGTTSTNGKLSLKGTFSNEIAYSSGYHLDTTPAAQSIANNGTFTISNFSGMVVVNNWASGGVTIFLCGGGATAAVSTVAGGSGGSFAYNSGAGGYTYTNTAGYTTTIGVAIIRTRTTA